MGELYTICLRSWLVLGSRLYISPGCLLTAFTALGNHSYSVPLNGCNSLCPQAGLHHLLESEDLCPFGMCPLNLHVFWGVRLFYLRFGFDVLCFLSS